LAEYDNIFRDHLGQHGFFMYKFNVINYHLFKLKPYLIPFSCCTAVQHELNRILRYGVIEKLNAAYKSHIVSVQKPDGSIRLCLDARKINTLIEPTRDAFTPIDEILAKFHNKSYFTTLDLTSGYWQIPLDPAVRKYSSFLYDG